MFLRLETINEKRIVGKKLLMSVFQNRTPELFRSFMPHCHIIDNRVNEDILCIQDYDPDMSFSEFTVHTEYNKWAAVEVTNFGDHPSDMERMVIPAGIYAVFLHKGNTAAFAQTFGFIFGQWLPASPYQVDGRPHFEVLGEKYIRDHEDSEEEVWIPVKLTSA